MPDEETEVRTPLPPAPQEKLLLPQVDEGRKKDSDLPRRELTGMVFPASAKDLAASTLLDSNRGGAGGRPKNAAEFLFQSIRLLLPQPPRMCAGKLSLRLLRLCLNSMPAFASAPSFGVWSSSGSANDRPTDPTPSGSFFDVLMGLPKTAAAPEQPYAILAGV